MSGTVPACNGNGGTGWASEIIVNHCEVHWYTSTHSMYFDSFKVQLDFVLDRTSRQFSTRQIDLSIAVLLSKYYTQHGNLIYSPIIVLTEATRTQMILINTY